MSGSFVHLHLRTEYSIVDSILQVSPLLSELKKQAAPAVAITDICNFFGMVKFYKAAMAQGIKPIIGTELWVQNAENKDYHKLVLLCQNQIGYNNLTRLISRAYQIGERVAVPLIQKNWLSEFSEGLIALSGAQYGEVGKALLFEDNQKASLILTEWMALFPNRFYIEIQRNHRAGESNHEKKALQLATQLQCPVVATNEVLFLDKKDYEAHKTRVCIQEGTTLEQFAKNDVYNEEQYLKSPEEMRKLFWDLPQALDNTVEIAKRCSLILTLDQPVLPSFPVPSPLTEKTYIEKASNEGLQKRLAVKFAKKAHTPEEISNIQISYQARLDTELAVINSMGFPGYFLIVSDFIQWAKNHKIAVGPGRGSGAGSLVAYALSITDLDPIEYELLFERFLNPDRVSLPDFDIDFCMDNRDKVIDYVASHYGRDKVCQIATFGTMAAKAVVRDVGRALGHPYGFVDKIAKLIPFEIGMTLEKALSQEMTLQQRYKDEEEVKHLIDLAMKLEGVTRNVGKHAGGVVIAPSVLTNFAPLYCEKDSDQVVVQFDKDDVEAIGLIKFDFLGLRTLTIIDWAVQNTNKILEKQNLPPINIELIPLDDEATFDLLKKCATTAVFQLESRGMKELIKRLQPDQFEEIIALVALFRPGPLQSGMVDDFINRKHGRAKVEYPHPAIEPILKPTYGVILYQEQVMQIAQVLAGYSLGGADLLRRAMGKKKPEEMAQQRAIFTEGAVQNGVEEKTATYIFDLMEKFAGYGFNKSHSAAYALVSYQTAWLKAHYPSAFMAAVLSADMAHTDKVVNFIDECRLSKIKVIPPDVHQSEYCFTVNDNDQIVYGLGAIKGVGEAAIHHIIEERNKGPFKHLFDFCERVDNRKVNKRVLEALIKSGSFDCFGEERSCLMASIEEAMKQSEQQAANQLHGQQDLFGGEIEPHHITSRSEVKPWTTEFRLQCEKESLGMYVSGHPLEVVAAELAHMRIGRLSEVTSVQKEKKLLIAGLVVSLKSLQTKNGDRMAVVTFDDRYQRFEIAIFPDTYQKFRELLVADQLLVIEVMITNDKFSGGLKVRAQSLYTLDQAREIFVKKICINLDGANLSQAIMDKLKEYLMLQERGACPVYIEYQNDKAKSVIKLGDQWGIKPAQSVINALNEMMGQPVARWEYS